MGAYPKPDGNKLSSKADIPEDLQGQAEESREQLVEAAAENDDLLIEKFFEGELTEEEIITGLSTGIAANQFIPVLCGSAINNIGIQPLMDILINCFPSPAEAKPVVSLDGGVNARAFFWLAHGGFGFQDTRGSLCRTFKPLSSLFWNS